MTLCLPATGSEDVNSFDSGVHAIVDKSARATRNGLFARRREGVVTVENDVAYFNRRASEERNAATEAAHPNARQAHLKMAERYKDMASAIAAADLSLQSGRTEGVAKVSLSA